MLTAATTHKLHECLLQDTIDEQALSQPNDIYYSIPKDDNDLSQGFVDISCGKFANAVNHAATWMQSALGKASTDSSNVIAYQGPNDLRYPILALAAAKSGRQVDLHRNYG